MLEILIRFPSNCNQSICCLPHLLLNLPVTSLKHNSGNGSKFIKVFPCTIHLYNAGPFVLFKFKREVKRFLIFI